MLLSKKGMHKLGNYLCKSGFNMLNLLSFYYTGLGKQYNIKIEKVNPVQLYIFNPEVNKLYLEIMVTLKRKTLFIMNHNYLCKKFAVFYV